MLIVDGVFIPRAMLTLRFQCDYEKCGGKCCVSGDQGAPIEKKEIDAIRSRYDDIFLKMDEEAQDYIRKKGIADEAGSSFATKCLGETGRCVFTRMQPDQSVSCILETLSENIGVPTLRPVSCRLFPLRVRTFNGLTILDYEVWEECRYAWNNGMLLLDFCHSALVDRFGEAWMRKLQNVRHHQKNAKNTQPDH